jgi:DNA-binding beta-propeller fold protein YncE
MTTRFSHRLAKCRLAEAACGITLMLLAGCSQPVVERKISFFPPPPSLPRIQFLRAFRGRKDVEEQSAFNRFVVGEKKDVQVDKPYGVAIYKGKIYVCDTNRTVEVFDLEHKTFGPLEGAKGLGTLRQPINITIDADGNKYVADPIRGQIVVFDANDAYVKAYGAPGNWKPVDSVPYGNELYVADAAKGLVIVIDRQTGETVRTIGDKGEPAERLDRPTNLAVDTDGTLYVTDIGRFQVVEFDREGHFKSTIGKLGDNLGHFARPKGIAVDREGRVYVVDAAFNNVQIFNREGRLLLFFGGTPKEKDAPGALLLPAKVTIDYDNLQYFKSFVDPNFEPVYLVLVTSQVGDHPVSVMAYGQEKGKSYPTDQELLDLIKERQKEEVEKLKGG